MPSVAQAAPTGVTVEQVADVPLTPAKIIGQARLRYPPEAQRKQAHGDVSLLVDVDILGVVTAVRFEHGPAVFKLASLEAAKSLRFEPATRASQPVAVTTRVWFHFAPPEQAGGLPTAEIVVHGNHPDVESTKARTTLGTKELERATDQDFAATIAQVPGVRAARGLSDNSKPIIRGHHERRLLVLSDGVRHESQKWGPDHATEIDPFSAGTISVIRGAAGARYGPDAIGGVVLVKPPALRSEAGVGGTTAASLASNGLRGYGALRVDGATTNGWAIRLEGNGASGASQSAPNYLLGNTASNTWNIGTAIQHEGARGQLRASWHRYDFEGGVFYGVNNTTPDEFEAQLDASQPSTADVWTVTREIDRPYQKVTHDLALLRAEVDGEAGSLEATYAYQHNHRAEYEPIRGDGDYPQFDFLLRTHSLDLVYAHAPVATSLGQWFGSFGVQGTFQENVYRGLSLIPNYRSFSGGIFAIERLSLSRVDIEAGGRFDSMTRDAYLRDNDYDAHVRRGTLSDNDCSPGNEVVQCSEDYTAASLSVGSLVHVVPEHLDIKLDLSRASRFPNIDELYQLGSAPSFPVYATGQPDLSEETAWGASLTTGLRTEALESEVSVFAQHITDYIYFSPNLGPDGTPRLDMTIRGTWPSWGHQSIDANVRGLDGSLYIGPLAPVGLEAVGALVRATNADTTQALVGVPSDYLSMTLIGRPPPLGPLRENRIGLGVELVAKQSRVRAQDDFAPAPDEYTLISASLETHIGRSRVVRAGLSVRNLLNTSYREYTSLLRYYADQPGRDIRLRFAADF